MPQDKSPNNVTPVVFLDLTCQQILRAQLCVQTKLHVTGTASSTSIVVSCIQEHISREALFPAVASECWAFSRPGIWIPQPTPPLERSCLITLGKWATGDKVGLGHFLLHGGCALKRHIYKGKICRGGRISDRYSPVAVSGLGAVKCSATETRWGLMEDINCGLKCLSYKEDSSR